jgi:hypothetical protein
MGELDLPLAVPPLALAQVFLRPLAFRDIHHGAQKLNKISGRVDWVSHYVDEFDCAFRKDNSVIQLETLPFTDCFINNFSCGGPILRMNELANCLK